MQHLLLGINNTKVPLGATQDRQLFSWNTLASGHGR